MQGEKKDKKDSAPDVKERDIMSERNRDLEDRDKAGKQEDKQQKKKDKEPEGGCCGG